MRFVVELHWSFEIRFSSHKSITQPGSHTPTSLAKDSVAPPLDPPTYDFASASTEPCQNHGLHPKQRSISLRTHSIRKSLKKMVSHFSRERSSKSSAAASGMTSPIHSTQNYGHISLVELPEGREPCELPTYTFPAAHQQLDRHENLNYYAPPVDGVAWQRHQSHLWVHGSPTNADCVFNTPPTSSRALTPIDTSVKMVRASPSCASGQYVSPSNSNGHHHWPMDLAGASSLSPPSTLSPSSFHTSPSKSVSPNGSVVSDPGEFNTAGYTTYIMATPNRPIEYGYGYPNTYSDFYTHGRHPYNPIASPVPSASRHVDNIVLADPHSPLATTAVDLHNHVNQLSSANEHSIRSSYGGHNQSAPHQLQCAHFGPANDSVRFAHMRLLASEQYINALPPHTTTESRYVASIPQHTPCDSFNLDESLPSYEASRNVPKHMESQGAQEIQEGPRPLGRQNRLKRATGTAARALVKILPLPCPYCGVHFTGKYRKANQNRHVNSFHTNLELGIDDGRDCRTCPQRFGRADARRKHEWKKHRTEDCRPIKRRIEKRGGEKRIYMLPVPDEHEDWR